MNGDRNFDDNPPRGGKLLLDSKPLVVVPELACVFGLNEAIVLQQVHYWLRIKHTAKAEGSYRRGPDGAMRWWVYNSIREWQEQFPFWSESTIRRAFTKLEERGVLLSAQLADTATDRRKWYSIDYDVYDKCILSEWTNGTTQDDQMDSVKMDKSSYTENPSENTPDTPESTPPSAVPPDKPSPTEVQDDTPDAPAPKSQRDTFNELIAWLLYNQTPDQLSLLSGRAWKHIHGTVRKLLKAGATERQVRRFWEWWKVKPHWKWAKDHSRPLPSDITDCWAEFLEWYDATEAYEAWQREQDAQKRPRPVPVQEPTPEPVALSDAELEVIHAAPDAAMRELLGVG
jgi:hypothetical protein